MKELNIYQRVNEVKKVARYAQKDAKVQGYKAVTHDQVTAVLRAPMVENGIVVTQSVLESSFADTGDLTAKGTKWMMYTAKYLIKFVNIDKPDDFIEVNTEAQALDTGDKASGKAMSYAIKYAMLKVFGLETGENEEGRQDNIQAKRDAKKDNDTLIDASVAKVINDLVEKTESNMEKMLGVYGVASIEEMTISTGRHVIGTLRSKIK
jgi:hypothetical protein